MSFKKSSSYVQRQTNKMLRFCKNFVKIYVNDIITYSRIFKKHFVHFRQLFNFFRQKRVSLISIKSYLNYSLIMLLNQRVNSLNMIIVEKKIAVITSLLFSINFKKLNTFLDFIDWLRSFIERYVQRVQFLQKRKIALIRELSINIKKSTRKRKTTKIQFYEFIYEKLQFFKNLKKTFRFLTFLTHYDRKRKLFVDLNSSKNWNFVDMMYHVKKNSNDDFSRIKIQSIMFFNRCFNETEKNYWFTELKITEIVWIIRKIRHMIESNECFSIIIYIDHSAIVSISRQINLITFNTDKLNLRFIRISQYLFDFNLQVKHKIKKFNVIFDVLSRLQTDVIINEKIDVFETLYEVLIHLCKNDLIIVFSKSLSIYHITFVKLTNEFKIRLQKVYNKNNHWFKILKMFTSKIKKKQSFFRKIQLWTSIIIN